jgi:hypothetical protein
MPKTDTTTIIPAIMGKVGKPCGLIDVDVDDITDVDVVVVVIGKEVVVVVVVVVLVVEGEIVVVVVVVVVSDCVVVVVIVVVVVVFVVVVFTGFCTVTLTILLTDAEPNALLTIAVTL